LDRREIEGQDRWSLSETTSETPQRQHKRTTEAEPPPASRRPSARAGKARYPPFAWRGRWEAMRGKRFIFTIATHASEQRRSHSCVDRCLWLRLQFSAPPRPEAPQPSRSPGTLGATTADAPVTAVPSAATAPERELCTQRCARAKVRSITTIQDRCRRKRTLPMAHARARIEPPCCAAGGDICCRHGHTPRFDLLIGRSCRRRLHRQLEATGRAGVVLLQPRGDAAQVVGVAARHTDRRLRLRLRLHLLHRFRLVVSRCRRGGLHRALDCCMIEHKPSSSCSCSCCSSCSCNCPHRCRFRLRIRRHRCCISVGIGTGLPVVVIRFCPPTGVLCRRRFSSRCCAAQREPGAGTDATG
jgi:hypothetical protein